MFTSINAVLKQLNAEGWNDITLEYINKGVMTDTYKMHTKTKKYAVRCYPNPRRWLAEVEYSASYFIIPINIVLFENKSCKRMRRITM